VSTFLLVCLGGAAGSGARYVVSHGLTRWALQAHGSAFPWGTLVMNVVGSFLLGFLMTSRVGTADGPAAAWRFALGTGALGGFTTYSTFNYETLCYLESGHLTAAGANIALTMVVCLLAGLAGMALARTLLP
jgi:CrcB protein